MIFYFSGTGNTRWAARQLAKATGETLISITEALHNGKTTYRLAEGERIGFCFPVHGWQPPQIVRRFIRQLSLQGKDNTHFCYALCTCGDDIGRTDVLLRRTLQKAGWGLHAVFSLRMRNTYVCLPGFDTDSAEVEQAKEKTWKTRLEEVIQVIEHEGRSTAADLIPGALPGLKTYVLRPLFNRFLISPSRFRVDEARCKHCGACAQVCPLQNISLENADRLPHWGNHCTHCLACYHVCTAHAVNYGSFTRHKGQVKVLNSRNDIGVF